MLRIKTLALAVPCLLATTVLAVETVGVSGSNARFATAVERKVGDKSVKLHLTGAAMRKKLFFNVYALGSYVQEGVSVRTAEELAATDCAKQLHLVMERDVGGSDMAASFKESIRMNHPAPRFEAELNTLVAFMEATSVQQGDHVWLTHVPGVGFEANVAGKKDIRIKNVGFAKAIWDIYLGKNNLGAAIKQGLVSRL
jgi:hypothetical protein